MTSANKFTSAIRIAIQDRETAAKVAASREDWEFAAKHASGYAPWRLGGWEAGSREAGSASTSLAT